jgi:hypothetical protein
MIKQVEVLVIQPAWMLLFILSYMIGSFVWFKTENLFYGISSFFVWSISTVSLIYWYYGVPF